MSGSLPSGWSNARSSDDRFTPIILALSLLLAIIICCLIGGLVWRRKRRASLDVEKKAKRDLYPDDETEVEEIKRYRTHQRMFAKASARWKAGVRARRRRKRPLSVAQDIPHEPSTVSLTSRCSCSAAGDDGSDCESVTAADEIVAAAPEPVSLSERARTDGETQDTDGASEVPPDASRLAQPPEYPLDGALVGVQGARLDQPVERPDGTEAGAPSLDHTATSSPTALSGHDRPPYTEPVNSAHLATDDKALLERMVDLASHPPAEGSSRENVPRGESSSPAGPSVPILDEFEELPPDLDESGGSGTHLDWRADIPPSSLSNRIPVPTYSCEPPPSAFPAPPTKAQLAASSFYEYPAFEEDDAGDGLDAPSAPPFDFDAPGPSAPPLDGELDACACAPPLIDEDEEVQLGFVLLPSAPPPPEVSTAGSAPGPEAGPSTGLSPPNARPSAPYLSRAASPPDYLP